MTSDAAGGFAMPLVCLFAAGASLAALSGLQTAGAELRGANAGQRRVQLASIAELAQQVAAQRLLSTLVFPATGCAQGLCANRRAPVARGYDWSSGTQHQSVDVGLGSGWVAGYWVELLGEVAAGVLNDCRSPAASCRYVRLVAGSASDGRALLSLESVWRVDRQAPGVQSATRLSWRHAHIP